MKLTTVNVNGKECAAVVSGSQVVLIETINEAEHKQWSTDMLYILRNGQLEDMNVWYKGEGERKLHDFPGIPLADVQYAPLYRNPGKILGVGMNYVEKAIELSGKPFTEDPVIFMKPDTSLIGHGDAIRLPLQSSEVTAEAELGIIIGKTCKDVAEQDASSVIAGFTTTLDMTAKDIHAKNPRYLQRSKSFDTFFSFGPHFLTVDEFPLLQDVTVETVLNGQVYHRNIVANMIYEPNWIVSFFSGIMTLYPGDMIMTGTPGSVVIREGDIVECGIPEFQPLQNGVTAASV